MPARSCTVVAERVAQQEGELAEDRIEEVESAADERISIAGPLPQPCLSINKSISISSTISISISIAGSLRRPCLDKHRFTYNFKYGYTYKYRRSLAPALPSS